MLHTTITKKHVKAVLNARRTTSDPHMNEDAILAELFTTPSAVGNLDNIIEPRHRDRLFTLLQTCVKHGTAQRLGNYYCAGV